MGDQKNNSVAIVTGASSGIGLGITRALLQHDYSVVANSRTISRSKELKPSENLALVDGNIGDKEIAIKVVDAAIKQFGRVDLLVNSAGIYLSKPFTDYSPADFELMIATNVAGYFFLTQQVVPHMRKQKSGHVVGISTVLTDQPLAGAHIALAVLTKSTIPAFSRALAMEFVAPLQHHFARRCRYTDARQGRSRASEKIAPCAATGADLGHCRRRLLFAISNDGKRRKYSDRWRSTCWSEVVMI